MIMQIIQVIALTCVTSNLFSSFSHPLNGLGLFTRFPITQENFSTTAPIVKEVTIGKKEFTVNQMCSLLSPGYLGNPTEIVSRRKQSKDEITKGMHEYAAVSFLYKDETVLEVSVSFGRIEGQKKFLIVKTFSKEKSLEYFACLAYAILQLFILTEVDKTIGRSSYNFTSSLDSFSVHEVKMIVEAFRAIGYMIYPEDNSEEGKQVWYQQWSKKDVHKVLLPFFNKKLWLQYVDCHRAITASEEDHPYFGIDIFHRVYEEEVALRNKMVEKLEMMFPQSIQSSLSWEEFKKSCCIS